ncbi:UNVERIFIED_CONTAM: hypothetical protein GTU68_059545 [Idotea baltica]|nr:hypothetical protein [Idotea baltica]
MRVSQRGILKITY